MLTGEGSLTLGVFCHAVAVFARVCSRLRARARKQTHLKKSEGKPQ